VLNNMAYSGHHRHTPRSMKVGICDFGLKFILMLLSLCI
jgi:hypothetical protein